MHCNYEAFDFITCFKSAQSKVSIFMNDWFVSVINKFYFNVFGMLIQVLHKPKAIVIYMYLYPKKAVPVLNLLSDAFMAI